MRLRALPWALASARPPAPAVREGLLRRALGAASSLKAAARTRGPAPIPLADETSNCGGGGESPVSDIWELGVPLESRGPPGAAAHPPCMAALLIAPRRVSPTSCLAASPAIAAGWLLPEEAGEAPGAGESRKKGRGAAAKAPRQLRGLALFALAAVDGAVTVHALPAMEDAAPGVGEAEDDEALLERWCDHAASILSGLL